LHTAPEAFAGITDCANRAVMPPPLLPILRNYGDGAKRPQL